MEKEWASGACIPERGHRRGGFWRNLEILPEEWGVSSLSWSENQWDWQRGCKHPRLGLWRVRTCLLKQGRGSRLKQPSTPADFLWLPRQVPQLKSSIHSSSTCSMEQLHIRVRGGHSIDQPRPSRASEWGKNGHCWQWISSGLELGLVLGLPESVLWPIPSIHSDPSCSSIVLLWGKVGAAERRETTHLRKWNPLRHDPQDLCSSDLGPTPIPSRVMLASEAGGKPQLTPGSGSGSSISSPTSYQDDSCQHLGKAMNSVTIRYSSPTWWESHGVHADCIWKLPHKDTP